ncbi:MAG TPA: hypothetical protein VL200_15290 [Lacunisphaera sp.]|jgi:hypothetical protein|nr:hypothetical protein [Lacunisphaera sp.]
MLVQIYSQSGNRRWVTGQSMILLGTGMVAVFSLLCWLVGASSQWAGVQINLLLFLLLTLNVSPILVELICRRFDPFDAKHLFLAYFFLIFTWSAFCEIKFEVVKPGLAVQVLDATTRVRALGAIVLGLAAFIIGCYLPIGAHLASALPVLPTFPANRVRLVSYLGIASGLAAFYYLMFSAGGISNFLLNLGTWRTVGVLAGVGYLTFPISTVLPASVLLLLLRALHTFSHWLSWRVLWMLLLITVGLGPVLILGFRVTLVPILVQFLMVWHYKRRRLRLRFLLVIAAMMIAGLSIYSNFRSHADILAGEALSEGVLLRTPGLATVERVVQRMDQGEPYRSLSSGVLEALTILVPRAIWPNKPPTAGLAFDDIFFYDYFIARGDPVDGLKSGIPPTVIGDALWTRGIGMVILGLLALGMFARTISTWGARSFGPPLQLFVYALFSTNLPIFVEAPQNALNTYVMLGAMCVLMVAAINVRVTGGRRLVPL